MSLGLAPQPGPRHRKTGVALAHDTFLGENKACLNANSSLEASRKNKKPAAFRGASRCDVRSRIRRNLVGEAGINSKAQLTALDELRVRGLGWS